MDINILEELGLSRNESKIYLTLLRIGKANSAELARESGVHRINVYDVINSLISKGIVSYISESGTRIFKPETPEKLKEVLFSKMESLDKILPDMLNSYNSKKEDYEVSILRGVEGKKTQFDETLKIAKNTKNCIFSPHGLTSFEKEPYKNGLKKWFELLQKKNVISKHLILDTPEAKNRIKKLKDVKKYSARFSKDINYSPVSWNACDNLLFLTFHVEPYLIIRIKSKEIAQSFINSFEIMWKSSNK
jgi:HTH-type transcriptional regulator, sugar sensing transcriptional regulator